MDRAEEGRRRRAVRADVLDRAAPRIEELVLAQRSVAHEPAKERVRVLEDGLVRVERFLRARFAHGGEQREELQSRHAPRDVVEGDLRIDRYEIGEHELLATRRRGRRLHRVGDQREQLGVHDPSAILPAARVDERLRALRRLEDRTLERVEDGGEGLFELLRGMRARIVRGDDGVVLVPLTEPRAADWLGRRLAFQDGRASIGTDADRLAEPRPRIERRDVRGAAAECVDDDRGDRARQPASVPVGELRLEVDDAARRRASTETLEAHERRDGRDDEEPRAEHARLSRAVGLRDRHVPRAGGRIRGHADLAGGRAVGARVEPGGRRLVVVARAEDDAVRARRSATRRSDRHADLLPGLGDVGSDVDHACGVAIDRQAERERFLLRPQHLDGPCRSDHHGGGDSARARTDVARRTDAGGRAPRHLGLASRVGHHRGREPVGAQRERAGDALVVTVEHGEHHALGEARNDRRDLRHELRRGARRAHGYGCRAREGVSLDRRSRDQDHRGARALHERRRVADPQHHTRAVGGGAQREALPVLVRGRSGRTLRPDPVAHGVLDDGLAGGIAQPDLEVHPIAGQDAGGGLVPRSLEHRRAGVLLARSEHELGRSHTRRLRLRAQRPLPYGLGDARDRHARHDQSAAIGVETRSEAWNAALEQRHDDPGARERFAGGPDDPHPCGDRARGHDAEVGGVELDGARRSACDGDAARACMPAMTDGDEERKRAGQPLRHLDGDTRAALAVGRRMDARRRRSTIELLRVPSDLERRARERHRMSHGREAVGPRRQLDDATGSRVRSDVHEHVEAARGRVRRERLRVPSGQRTLQEREEKEDDEPKGSLHDRTTGRTVPGSRNAGSPGK